MTIGATRAPVGQSVLSEGWFGVGIAVVAAGALMLVWSLVLFLAHRHVEAHIAAGSIHRSDAPRSRWRERRLDLINHKRVGEEQLAEGFSEAAAQQWTNSVLVFLRRKTLVLRRGFAPADVEQFLNAGSGTNRERMPDRLTVLGDVIEGLEPQPIRRRRVSTAIHDVLRGVDAIGIGIGPLGASVRLRTMSPPLDVTYAVYGLLDDPARQNDVTTIVRGLIRDGRLDFVADNAAMKGDPAPNEVKTLEIEFRLAGGESGMVRRFAEGSNVEIP